MLIQKNVNTSFLLNAGRRRSSVNGWSASYQLFDKSGNVIFPIGGGYSTQDLQEIGNGLYGVAITFTTTYCGFIHWKISSGATDIYIAEPFTVLSSPGNKGVEQTFLANFGKSRTGKSVEFRILKNDLTEERTWSDTGLIELGFGMYGVPVTINTILTGYIEFRNNTDGLYVSDPILIEDKKEFAATQFITTINPQPLKTDINMRVLDYKIGEIKLNSSLPLINLKTNLENMPLQYSLGG